MKQDDYTDMGGTGEVFLTTHWSVLDDAASAEEDRSRALIGLLLDRYWKPVYCYLRRKGYSNEEAKDLTQGFFHQVVLGRKLFQRADPSKGRFRSFLLSALNHYVINVHEAETARKRIPAEKLVSFEMGDPPDLPAVLTQSPPDDSFNYAWVTTLLEEVLADVEATCRRRNLTVHWQIFQDRLLRPTLRGTDPPSMKEICERYGVEESVKASNLITTVKKLFRTSLKQHVRRSVVSDAQVADELEEIEQFFRGNLAV
jgi:DNA-directed RNA polymerase specialized sigma24 family protein